MASPISSFDPFDPAIFDDPVPSYHWLLEEAPLYWCERGFWVLSRFDDVWQAALDFETYSSEDGNVYGGHLDAMKARGSKSIVMMDPPRHTRLRGLVSRAFTKRRMAEMRPQVAELARACIDRLMADPAPDFARDVAIPLPGTVIADAVGVERDQIDRLSQATVDMVLVKPEDADYAPRRAAAVKTLDDYLTTVVAARRAQPGDDLLSKLIDADLDGDRLSDAEIAGFGRALFNGGHGTTTTLLGASVVALAGQPEARARIVADGSVLSTAVEELVRFVSPVQGLYRTVTRDVTIRGQQLRAGDRVLLLLAAANRDPRVFADPDRIDVQRVIPRHLGFGVGAHLCIGAQLARVEAEVVLAELLARAPDYELAEEIHFENILSVRSLHHVPLRFAAGAAG